MTKEEYIAKKAAELDVKSALGVLTAFLSWSDANMFGNFELVEGILTPMASGAGDYSAELKNY